MNALTEPKMFFKKTASNNAAWGVNISKQDFHWILNLYIQNKLDGP